MSWYGERNSWYNAHPTHWVWSEQRPLSLHAVVVRAKRPPDEAESSRFPGWGMHGYATECMDESEADQASLRRRADLFGAGWHVTEVTR